MKNLKIGDLDVKVPIVQGGMGVGISRHKLASAVAEEGGIGVISAAGLWLLDDKYGRGVEAEKEALRDEIRKAKEKTKGVLGVNIMVALTNFEEMAITSIQENIDIIFAGAGLPLNLPDILQKTEEKDGKKYNIKLVPIISSAKAMNLISKFWIEKYNYVPDAFVLEGPKAGGHLGFKKDDIFDEKFTLENLVKETKSAIEILENKYEKKIPLIAAGGIFYSEDIKKIMSLGADGVQLGSRFVATEECDASQEFKNAFVNSKKEDIIIIESPVGLPGRALNGDFIKNMKKPDKCYFQCIKTCKKTKSPYCISLALANACQGNLKDGFVFTGANGYKIDRITTVKDLFDELINGK